MKLVWTTQLSVGNAVIDSDHKDLINQVNDLVHAIEMRNSSDIAHAFNHLEHNLCLHFANEKKIARAIGFDFSYHELVQQYGLNELQFLKGLLSSKKCLWFDEAIEHFTDFLESWIFDCHINSLDMRMKPVLQTLPYDFIPAEITRLQQTDDEQDKPAAERANGKHKDWNCPLRSTCKMPEAYCKIGRCADWFF